MTREQREKLNFIAGRLEGIAYGVDNENICDGIMKCSEEIDAILVKDSSRPTVATPTEQKIVSCCKNCKFETLEADDVPCNDCWYGNGSCIDINHWEVKEDAAQRAD